MHGWEAFVAPELPDDVRHKVTFSVPFSYRLKIDYPSCNITGIIPDQFLESTDFFGEIKRFGKAQKKLTPIPM